GGELLSTEPSLVQQHSIGCYGGSLSFESVFPSGLPALSKAQEAGWITPNQDFLEFGRINPLLFTGCKEGQAQDTFPNHTTLDHYRCRLRPSLPS
ncbi:unnamed protein product, partial [Merluccius merluccius]